MAVGTFTVDLIADRLTERVESELVNVRRLEVARLDEELGDYIDDASSIASGKHVVDFVGGVTEARRGVDARRIGGYDGFGLIDPDDERPLAELAGMLQTNVRTTGSEVVELQVVGTDGSIYGETSRFSWEPYDPNLISRALTEGRPLFGNAFLTESGETRLGLVAPVATLSGEVVGALVMENNLGPIVDLVGEYENFGETSESHIVQPNADGDAELITVLRFERDAAFMKVVPSGSGSPIAESLLAPDGKVILDDDYRGEDSILAIETIEATGWGLVVKIDSAEALAPVGEVRRALALAGMMTVLLLISCTAALLNPLGRRLRRLSLAAKQVAAGDYQSSIGDESGDEVGVLARSIDQLAADLDADIRMRTLVELKLRHQATHDDLTEIYNRHYATQEIRRMSDEGRERWSLLFIDLDGFKAVNDSYGHSVGDEVLHAVAGRLSTAAPEHATVARWGGDEFVVILPEQNRSAADEVADQIRLLFAHPVTTSIGEQLVRCSIGVAAADGDSLSLDDVLHEADSAMFQEKPQRRPQRRMWSRTERAVATALAEDRLDVWYQPVLTSAPKGQTVVGAEALVRLRTNDGDYVPPGEFLPDVVDRAVGVELDEYVTRIAAKTCAGWLEAGLVAATFQLSVNLGAGSLRDPRLADRSLDVLIDSRLPPHMLIVEISENADVDPNAIRQLGDIGISTAIDDVGIAKSNFDRLLQLRPRFAKIDRRWLIASHDETLVLRGLVETCHALDLQMIAEGVETADQHRLAHDLNIPYVQGFLFGHAVPGGEFVRAWLPVRDHRSSPSMTD
ncbi:MAG: putative bifunctional diguanylate cyclase/phosphodiesterase [Acidimicrobiales bacterium]